MKRIFFPLMSLFIRFGHASARTMNVRSNDAISSLILAATADPRVLESNPTTNYGMTTRLGIDNPGEESYLRFTVRGVTDNIQTVTLRLFVTNGSSNGPSLYLTDNSWTETGITWNNRAVPTSGVKANVGSIVAKAWTEYDLTGVVTSDGTYDFILLPDSTDGATFYSREGSSPPQLVLTIAAEQTPTSTDTPIPPNTATPGLTDTPTNSPAQTETLTPTETPT